MSTFGGFFGLGQAVYNYKCSDALQRNGIDVSGLRRIDSGAFGTAYFLKDGRVLKVTNDGSEGELAAWLLKHKDELPVMFPRLDAVFSADCAGRKDHSYIVREDLQDLSAVVGPLFDSYGNKVPENEIFIDIMGALMSWMNAAPYADADIVRDPTFGGDVQARDEYLRENARTIGFANNKSFIQAEMELERQLDYMTSAILNYEVPSTISISWPQNVYDSVDWCRRRLVFVTDLHDSNFGLRLGTNDLVIRDLGVSYTPEILKPAPLNGLRRRQGIILKARRL